MNIKFEQQVDYKNNIQCDKTMQISLRRNILLRKSSNKGRSSSNSSALLPDYDNDGPGQDPPLKHSVNSAAAWQTYNYPFLLLNSKSMSLITFTQLKLKSAFAQTRVLGFSTRSPLSKPAKHLFFSVIYYIYIHTYIHTYIYIYIYTHTCVLLFGMFRCSIGLTNIVLGYI